MKPAAIPVNEAERLRALERYQILDTPAEAAFDDLARLAARLCGAPIALISLVDAERQWCKAHIGLEIKEAPRAESFCAHAILHPGVAIFGDLAQDELFADSPLVAGPEQLRFYASAPLLTPQGHAVGTLAVLDRRRRHLNLDQIDALLALSRQVVTQLELRVHVLELEREVVNHQRTEAALRQTESKYRGIFENVVEGIFQTTPDGHFLSANQMLARIYGFASPEELIASFSDVSKQLYVDPNRRAEFTRLMEHREVIAKFESEVYHQNGSVIWISENSRAVRNAEGKLLYYEGTVEDITERKRSEEALLQSEARFRSVWEKSADGMRLTDRHGTILAVNPCFCDIVGLRPDELVGRPFTVVYPEGAENAQREQKYQRRFVDRNFESHQEIHFTFRAGKILHVELSSSFVEGVGKEPLLLSIFHNITERKRTEEALRDSELRFRSIWEKSADGMRLSDKDGITRAVNPAYCRLVGLPEVELIGHPYVADYLQGDEAEIRLQRYRESVRKRTIAERIERHVTLRSGAEADIELSNSFVGEGDDVLVLSILHDVTERKRAEAALRDSEVLYHSLVENLPQHIFRKDRTGHFTFVNPRFCAALGRSREEIMGKTDYDLFPAAQAEKYSKDDRRIMETPEIYDAVESHPTPDQGEIFVQVLKAPLVDAKGAVIGIQGIFWDVTERKRMEEQLAFERDLLRALLDNVPDRIYFKDKDSRFLQCSLAMARRLGLQDPDQVVGRTDFEFHPPENAREFRADEQRILSTGVPLINKIERQRAMDGSEIWASVTKVITRNRTGEVTGIIGISRDITDLIRTEQELAVTRDAALESARIKSQFLATMSHEIRTPMNAIVGMTGLILDTNLSAEQRDFAETVRTSAYALLDIINDILDFSKIEAGKLNLEMIDFDLHETVEGAVELLAQRAQAKGIELAGFVPMALPRRLRGDPSRIRQILVNLVGNAVKFTEHGEVIVRAAPQRNAQGKMFLRLAIQDTGIGIAPEARERIFAPFMQADGSTTRKYGGTGLGLAICKQLAELMGGEIGVESEPGRSSTFWFTIPLEAATTPTESVVVANPLLGVKILLVDDTAALRELLQDQTESWGMLSQVAADGAAALTLLRQAATAGQPFDVVVVDQQMPGMNGLELAHNVKADHLIGAPKIILLTVLGRKLDAELLYSAGIAACLLKPVKRGRLHDCLAAVIRGEEPTLEPILPAGELTGGAANVHHELRILLAEDNSVNQKVALLQLRKLGYDADVAANGEEVLTALKQAHYDLILMDCHMPVMDGYEATRRIRQQEQAAVLHEHPHPPMFIVAMTANALQGDFEECLAAGMNAYLTKPVVMEELQGLLERSSPRASAAREPVRSENNSAAGVVQPTLDLTVLAGLRELGEPGVFDPVEELIELFLSDAPEKFREMREAIAAHNAHALHGPAHTFKGSSNNLGARPMAALSGQLEDLAKRGKLDGAPELLEQLLAEFERVKTLLEAERKKSVVSGAQTS